MMHVHILIKVWDHRRGEVDTHGGQHRVIHICVQLSNVCGADMGSKVDMHTCTDICTHYSQSVGPEKRYLAYACGATKGHPCLHVTMQRGWRCGGVRWTCIHVLMHVHILIKVCMQKKDTQPMQIRSPGANIFVQNCAREWSKC